MRPHRFLQASSTIAALSLILAVIAIAAGHGWTDAVATGAETPDPAATATREAELSELADLRTEVALLQTRVAELSLSPTPTVIPSPTATPTPVPPVPMGQPLSYRHTWTITVTDSIKTSTVQGSNNSATAKGIYIVIRSTIVNNADQGQRFPARDIILVDEQDRTFTSAVYETIMVSENYSQTFPPSIPTATVWVFDVAPDVGNRFVLASRADPAFRVQVEIAQRG